MKLYESELQKKAQEERRAMVKLSEDQLRSQRNAKVPMAKSEKVSERSERALRKTRILAMDLAKWLQTATSIAKLTPQFVWLAWLAWLARAGFRHSGVRVGPLGNQGVAIFSDC